MARSAQDKFTAYLDECKETRDAINELTQASYQGYNNNYAYAAGYYETLTAELIGQLSKAKRAQYRTQLYKAAEKIRKESLDKFTA